MKRVALAIVVTAFALFGASLGAQAQNSWATPGGSVADGKVEMCLNSSGQAVPVSSGTCAGAASTVTANQGTQGSAGSAWYVQPGTGATFPLPTTPTVANGNGVIPSPSSESAAGLSKAQCSALCSNQIVKASSGNLYAFNVSADSTLSGAAWWILVFDATSLPANGAVTPAKCYAEPANTTGDSKGWGITPVAFGTGIVIGVSTTGCFSLTASTHAFISGDFK